MSTKLEKLVKLALSGDSQLSPNVTARGLSRLDKGNLSHIGDALIDADVILVSGCEVFGISFNDRTEFYTIKPDTITVNGVEINAPYREMPENRTEYYYPDLESKDFVTRCDVDGDFDDGEDFDSRVLNADAMFKTHDDCAAYVKAIGWVK